MAIFVHNSAQNYIKQNSDRAKDFTFRMSAPPIYSLVTVSTHCPSCNFLVSLQFAQRMYQNESPQQELEKGPRSNFCELATKYMSYLIVT